ncbi:MAG: cytochrome C [Pseudomonadota bacterium]
MRFPLLARLLLCCALACAPWLARAAQPAFQDTMAQRVLACTGCHGKEGRAGPDGYYPRIAGKPAAYLYNQLLNFREGRRQYAPMARLLEPLSDAYLMEIAQHFAGLQLPYPPPQAAAQPPELLLRGRLLAQKGDAARELPACAQCHGRTLTGMLPQVPGLLGLPRDYLNAQLGAWRTGQRRAHAPDCMAEIARKLTPEDLSAATGWLAAQPVPRAARPLPAPRKPTPGTPATPACGSAPPPAERP